MPGRQANLGSYRYGFQNQETDPEMLGGAVAFTYRVHDVRIGRFFSIDPLSAQYPYYTPYAFSGNRVVDAVKQEGLQPVLLGGPALSEGMKNFLDWVNRNILPTQDAWGLVSGKDFDGNQYNRAEAGVWLVLSVVPGSKLSKPVVRVIKGSSKFVGITMKFASPKHLDDHVKHFKKLGIDESDVKKAKEEYLDMANDFFKSESEDIITYAREGGDIVRYDKVKNIYGVSQSDGTIRTMFSPDNGKDYFKGEVKKDFKDLGEDAVKAVTDLLE